MWISKKGKIFFVEINIAANLNYSYMFTLKSVEYSLLILEAPSYCLSTLVLTAISKDVVVVSSSFFLKLSLLCFVL